MNTAHFQCLLDSNALAMGCWHADGTMSDANDALRQLLGRTGEDFDSGQVRWPDITPPEYAPLDAQALEEIQVCGTCVPFEKEYIRSDRTRVSVLVGGTAFEGEARDADVFFAVDLSRRKKWLPAASHEPESRIHMLTERQRLICALSSLGVVNRKIASVLDVGLRTVELEKHSAAKTLRLPTTSVALWAAENRQALLANVKNSGFVSEAIAKATEMKLTHDAHHSIPDSEKIDARNFPNLWSWANRLGVTREQLQQAVRQVGPVVSDVRKYLGK